MNVERRREVDAVAASALFVVCVWLRPDVAVGLVVLGAVFIGLERRWPLVEQRVLRAGWRTDVVHFVVDQVAAAAVVAALASVLVPWLEPLLPDLDTLIDSPLRLIIAAAIGEVAGYWGHRAMHRFPFLWRLHSVHHSAPQMDWLSPNRRHVLDTALGQAASVVPLLALGLSPPVVVSAFVLRRAQGLFVHANLRVQLPGLRWVIATPGFHHWHHSADPAHHDRNFAGQCPIVDWLFGTLHMPAGEWPQAYGLASGSDVLPDGYLARLRWPFRGVHAPHFVSPRFATAAFATLAIVSTTSAASYALSSDPAPWTYTCTLARDGTSTTIDIDARNPEAAAVQHIDGDPATGLGVRVIADGSVPMTLFIDGGPVDAVVAASAMSAVGPMAGTCTRHTDVPAK
ncbi:MAG TPA: sterol desaturase family protein [Acidimicrobiales bacterium]|nr:sterol desaturase family protein [Acidimicrobiales bacterium]